MSKLLSVSKFLFISLAILALLSACSGQPSIQASPTEIPVTASQPAKTVVVEETAVIVSPEEPAEEIVLIDAAGRTVTLDSIPRRIALAGRSLAILGDAVYLFPEAKERLVVMGKANQDTADFESLLDPAYGDKAVLESEVGAEQIAAFTPDLVLMKSIMSESLGKSLETIGIPVVYLDFETPEQYEQDLANLGKIFQNEDRAEELINYYRGRIAFVQDRLKDLPQDQKPDVLLSYYNDRDGSAAYNVPPLNWIQTYMVETAGGIPVWEEAQLGGGWTKVNLEQIAVWNPDKIFVIAYFNNPEEVTAALKVDPQWQALSALRNDNLYAFPKDIISWDQPNPRWILGLMWLAATTHPDLFPDLDLKEEMRFFYEELYSLSGDTYLNEILPRLQGDVN